MPMKEATHGGNVQEFAREHGILPEDILDYSSNVNPVPLPEKIKTYLMDHFAEIRRYPDREYLELRQAIARYTGCPVNWITVGNGATEIIYLAARTFKPHRVLIPAPSFGEYDRAFYGSETQVDYYRIKEELDFKLDIDNFLAELKQGYDMMIICNPNNPTGYLIPPEDLLEMLAVARESGTIVLLDETFIEFATGSDDSDVSERASILHKLKYFDNVILLRAFTKFFAVAGLRLGYCLAHPRVLEKMKVFREPWTVNAVAEMLAPILLEDREFIAKSKEWIFQERARMWEGLRQIEGLKVYPSSANFFLLKLMKAEWNVQLLAEILAKERIVIRDASSFRFLDTDFSRVAVKDEKSNIRLLEVLQRILNGC